MSEIQINGQRHRLENCKTLERALEQAGFTGEAFAVAVNGEFVPRGQYAQIQLEGGDCLDVVAPVVGG
ncbi:sulfur carrier protein ThiS [Microbulbifer discodermiae]|uniref:sulfur carrier protein ThiS n=1 Tax=Microbulbifer sp. 2201CG32-9 TaxID=3232309 RepID=UPI00345C5A80